MGGPQEAGQDFAQASKRHPSMVSVLNSSSTRSMTRRQVAAFSGWLAQLVTAKFHRPERRRHRASTFRLCDPKPSEPCNELQSAKLVMVGIRESEERHVQAHNSRSTSCDWCDVARRTCYGCPGHFLIRSCQADGAGERPGPSAFRRMAWWLGRLAWWTGSPSGRICRRSDWRRYRGPVLRRRLLPIL